MRVARFVLIWSLVAVFYFGGVVRAQEPVRTGSIEGTIKNRKGLPKKSRVAMVEKESGRSFFIQSDPEGHFHIPDVPVGEYFLFVGGGFLTSVKVFRVVVEPNSTRRIAIAAGPPAWDDVSILTGYSASIEDFRKPESIVFGTVRSAQLVERLKNGRNVFRIEILVGEVLKGIPPTVLSARYETDSPRPPEFLSEGKVVLAFLSRHEKSGDWRLERFDALDSDPFNLPESLHLKRIVTAVRDKGASRDTLVDMLIKELSEPVLRGKALGELRDVVERIREAENGKVKPDASDPYDLAAEGMALFTESRKNLIAEGLERIETPGEADRGFLRLLIEIEHPRIGLFLRERLVLQRGIPQKNTGLLLSLLSDVDKSAERRVLADLYDGIESAAARDVLQNGGEAAKSSEVSTDEALRVLIRAFLRTVEHPAKDAK